MQLNEGRLAPLYHNMNNTKAKHVFEEDVLYGRVTHRILGKGYQGVSLSRNPRLGGIKESWYGEWWLTLDQGKLAQRYKIIPVDADLAFYLTKNKKSVHSLTPKQLQLHQDRIIRQSHDLGGHHAEEFLIGDIEPLHPYVTRIVYLGGSIPNMKKYDKEAFKWRYPTYEAGKTFADKYNITFIDSNEPEQHQYWTLGHFNVSQVKKLEKTV